MQGLARAGGAAHARDLELQQGFPIRGPELDQRMGPAERALWQRLRGNKLDGWHFRRQHPVDGFVVDFFCAKAKLVVEVDGPIHRSQREYDAERTRLLSELKGYRVLRFTNEQVMNDMEEVIEAIRKALQEA